jgi:hypothetical protein
MLTFPQILKGLKQVLLGRRTKTDLAMLGRLSPLLRRRWLTNIIR